MKTVKVVLILVYVFISSIYAQQKEELNFNHQVIYELTYQPDSTNPSFKKIDLELLLNNEGSLFRSVRKGINDSALYAEKKTSQGMLVMRPVNKFNYQIVKRNGHIKTYDSPFGPSLEGKEDIYYYEEQQRDLDWQIKEDTLMIDDILCQRADLIFGGRHWIAWFAPEIPISDGPYKFCGLSGLIVSIYDAQEYWRFDMVSLRNVNKEVVIHFENWYTFSATTKKKLFKERRDFQNNLFSTVEAAGHNFDDPKDKTFTHERARSSVKEFMEKDNNWIELDMQ